MSNTESFNTIVLSGGSIKGFSILGTLFYVYLNQMMNNVTTYIGTSIGSIICYLLIIGYTPMEIVLELFISKILEKIQSFDIINLVHGEGAMSFLVLQDQLEKMTINKIGSLHTLKSLKEKFNKELICITYNYTKKKEECLSYETHPDLPCITALRMSSNLPIIFENFKYMDDYYLDGGLVNNFPINHVKVQDEKVLGIYIASEASHTQIDTSNITTIIKYLYSIITIPINQITRTNVHRSSGCKIIEIKTLDINMLNFNLSTSEKLNLFSDGFTSAKNFFEK